MAGFVGIFVGILIYFRSLKKERRKHGLVVRSGIYRAVWIVALLVFLMIPSWISREETATFYAVYLIGIPVLWPDLIQRVFLRPMGWTQGALAFSLMANWTWRLAPLNGAVCGALLTRLRSQDGRHPRPVEPWLQKRRPPEPGRGPLVATHVLAEALRAMLRGEQELTKILMETILLMPPGARSRRESGLAKEWLLLNAAQRGAWEELRTVHRQSRDLLFFGLFLSTAGQALTGQVTRWKLALRWLVCGRQWSTRHLLLRAWRVSGRQPEAEESILSEVERARGLAVAGSSVPDTAAAWQQALGSEVFQRWLEERCEALELDVAESSESVHASIAEVLADLATTSGSAVPETFADGFMDGQQENALRRLDENLELIVIRSQGEVTTFDDPHEELDTWVQLRRSFDVAMRLGAPRPALYFQVLGPMWSWAGYLHEKRRERPMAQAIFSWLHRWADEVGDVENERTLGGNVKLGV